MADDEQQQYEVDPDLFDNPTAGGGAYWKAKEGSYRVQLLRFEKGPDFDRDRKVKGDDGRETVVKEKQGTVRWVMGVYRLSSGKRVTYVPEEGEKAGQTLDAEGDGLTSRVFSKASKTGKWLRAFLGHDIDWAAMLAAGESEQARMKAALMQEALGKWAVGTWAPAKSGDRIVLTEVGVFDDDSDDEAE